MEDKDRIAADTAYRDALTMAELEYASLQDAVQRSNKLRTFIRSAYSLLNRELDDKYKTAQELGMWAGVAHTGSNSNRSRHGDRRTDTSKQPQGQILESPRGRLDDPRKG